MSVKALQDYTFKAKYAAYLPDKKRRENWNESVNRSKNMMLKKYAAFPEVERYVDQAYSAVKRKEVLGSQRALQFAGEAMFKHNARGYNCCSSYVDRARFFQECMYLLLCGAGCGFSVQNHHVNKLPKLTKEKQGKKTYRIPDSIEGWSDAIGILVCSYFEPCSVFDEFSGYDIKFDYTLIRQKGAPISSCSGKAPGPEPLKIAIGKIRELLDKAVEAGQTKLRPIQAYDIVMHLANAVISGGVRRSATICIFSPEDEEMMNAKTGDWFYSNPQRGRSNNSCLLLRNQLTFDEFNKFIPAIKEFGEPGFVFADSPELVLNPCQPSWATVLTKTGISTIGKINIGDEIWSESGWTKVTKKWSTGLNDVYEYKTTGGTFYSTENHRIVSNGEKIQIKDADSIDVLVGPRINTSQQILPEIVMDGLVFGDGTVHKASNNLITLLIGDDDKDYFNSEIKDLILEYRPSISKYSYTVKTSILYSELPKTFLRKIPDRFIYSDNSTKCSFLRGLYSANGSVVNNRITLKSTSFDVIKDVQLMLSSLGIKSYYTENKGKTVDFKNGIYQCKDSYDLNISVDRTKFVELIGFIQDYKNKKINNVKEVKGLSTYNIISINKISNEETFDMTVDNDSHTYWSCGFNTSNCVEIGFWCYDIIDESKYREYVKTNGYYKAITENPEDIGLKSGWQCCNLSTQNCAKIKTVKDFFHAAKNAAIIGTLQAGFDDFPYLGETTNNIVRREALLGVSMTGILDAPDVCLNPEVQKRAARIARKTNKKVAKIININPAARVTCVKPEGSTSCVLGTASGIHPHHSHRYIRRVQANKTENIYQFYKKYNPLSCEKSVWSTNDTDDVISFCIELSPRSKTKHDISGSDLLDLVKLTQENWVLEGRNIEYCTQPWLSHNVSNTIHVKSNEWDDIVKKIFDNREYYCGISLIPESGDLDYSQAPFVHIHSPEEIVKKYGEAAIFASGVIEEAKNLFEDDLWKACDAAVGIITVNGKAKQNWVERVKRYADRYCKGNLKELLYCLKSVDLYKTWCDLNREYLEVNYDKCFEDNNQVEFTATSSCSGGKCEIF